MVERVEIMPTTNPETLRAKKRRYRQRHRDVMRAKRRRYYQRYRERFRMKAWLRYLHHPRRQHMQHVRAYRQWLKEQRRRPPRVKIPKEQHYVHYREYFLKLRRTYRAKHLSAVHAYDKRRRWVIARLIAMARDDGRYALLAQEYDRDIAAKNKLALGVGQGMLSAPYGARAIGARLEKEQTKKVYAAQSLAQEQSGQASIALHQKPRTTQTRAINATRKRASQTATVEKKLDHFAFGANGARRRHIRITAQGV
jgi:hypothetical protein